MSVTVVSEVLHTVKHRKVNQVSNSEILNSDAFDSVERFEQVLTWKDFWREGHSWDPQGPEPTPEEYDAFEDLVEAAHQVGSNTNIWITMNDDTPDFRQYRPLVDGE